MTSNTMDPECLELCKAINTLYNIYTTESCCGHGKDPYHIWFKAKSLRALPKLLYWFDTCHCGFPEWKVIARTDCVMSPVSFLIEGPTGEEAYKQASEIADLITGYEKELLNN